LAKIFLLSRIWFSVVTINGCNRDISAGVDLDNATEVSFEEFKEATKTSNILNPNKDSIAWEGTLKYLRSKA
jgi:hypothetical protein